MRKNNSRMNTYYYLIPEAARKLAICAIVLAPYHTDNRKLLHKLRLQTQWRRFEQHQDWRFL